MNVLHLLPGCHVERICQIGPTGLQLEAHGVRDGARCPACGVWSEAGHGSYLRRPADLPLLGTICADRSARASFSLPQTRRVDAAPSPNACPAWSRLTPGAPARLAAAQGAVAVALGGEAGALACCPGCRCPPAPTRCCA